MANTYSIQLEHGNLVPGSEVITVSGGQFDALVKDQDYTIDYVNGIVNILLDGGVARLPGVRTNDTNLSITYRRKVDFTKEANLDSHIEVYGEITKVSGIFEVSVAQKPINSVFRVFNKTTGEEYSIVSYLNDTVSFSGVTAPRTLDLTDTPAEFRDRSFTGSDFINTIAAVLPDELKPAKEHLISTSTGITAWTLFKYLIQGGITVPQSTYAIEITSNVSNIKLITGSPILRRCTKELIQGTDYTAITDDTQHTLTIQFTSTGLNAIQNNSVFYQLSKSFGIYDQILLDNTDITVTEHQFIFHENYISEVSAFGPDGFAYLQKLQLFVKKGQEVDNLLYPAFIVTNRAGDTSYVFGVDYTLDPVYERLVRIETGAIASLQLVNVIYKDEESFTIDQITIAQDVVLVDYDHGTNSIDWTPSFIDVPIQEVRQLVKDLRFVTLKEMMANDAITMYRTLSNGTIQSVNITNVDLLNHRIQFDPLPENDTYYIDYIARTQAIDPGTNYFVTYQCGARREALINNYAELLGLTTGITTRTEQFDMVTKQSSVQLGFTPADPTKSVIYETSDPEKAPVTTITAFDASTNTLHFIPIISAGKYSVDYPVTGFQTEALRKAVQGLLEAVRLGPTKLSIERAVERFTGITPTVVDALNDGFKLTNGTDSDYLAPLPPVVSPPLSDGSSSIAYAASRFNTGLELKANNNAWVAYSALNDLRVDEGSFSLLLGTLWDGDDKQSHYLLDMVGTNEFTNRITLYKNKRNSLVFEIHDADSNVHRVTTDVTWIPRKEIHYLNKGQNQVKLAYPPSYTIMDFNANGQSDIFEANRTEFVITPIYGGPSGLGLNITVLIQIPNDPTFATEAGQGGIANKLRTTASIFEGHGAKLTIQTEMSFIQGCKYFDNVLLELFKRGHDVHLFLDIPANVISDEDRDIYILERRNALAEIGIGGATTDGVAGGYVIGDFATRFPALGFEYASAYKDPMTGESLPFHTEVFRASSGPDFTIPDPNGNLVYLPGDTGIDFQHNPMIVQSFIPITNSLITAMLKSSPDRVNTWYFVLGINDFTNYETILMEQWLINTVDPLVATGRVAWRTLLTSYNLFLEYEKFLQVNRNRVRSDGYGYGYGGIQLIRALQWNQVKKTLTFDSVDKAGYYLFSYIAGFSKFEEAEHQITCTWKLHTKDSQPPVIKMFLDGDLVNHKTFGDL